MTVSRRQIVGALKARGWQVRPDALKQMEAYLEDETRVDESLLHGIARCMANSSNKAVTGDIWEQYLDYEREQDEHRAVLNSAPLEYPFDENTNAPSGSRPADGAYKESPPPDHKHASIVAPKFSYLNNSECKVTSAFRDVRLSYHTMKKQFQAEEQPWPLFGKAEDKVHMHAQRYALTHQRLLRHHDFRPKDLVQLGSAHESVQYRLTPIESLLGRQKQRHEKSILLLGLLQQVEEGQYYLEDLTGQVPISFQHAIVMEGFFITEGNILLVEGVFQDGILHALRIGHPMLEERQESLSIIQQQVRHEAFSNLPLPLPNAPVVVLSDVHLDQPRVVQQLESLFNKYESLLNQSDSSSMQVEPLFCLMGNFCSQFHLHPGEAVRQALEELARTIAGCKKLSERAHFCLIPGPNDGVGHCLPYSWPKSLSTMPCWNKVRNIHLTSNPSKISWNGTAMTVFRHNTLSLMQQQQIPLPVDKEAGDIVKVPHLRLIKTILDQGHLLPWSGAPIYWNYDHALRLYPLPETLILGSSDSDAFYEVYGGVDVLHPGSFAKQGEFARHFPDAIEDNDEEDGDVRVSLDRVDENWSS